MGLVEDFCEILAEVVGNVLVADVDANEPEIDLQALAKSGEVVDCLDEGLQDGLHHVLAKIAGSSDWNSVTEDHLEAFLIY